MTDAEVLAVFFALMTGVMVVVCAYMAWEQNSAIARIQRETDSTKRRVCRVEGRMAEVCTDVSWLRCQVDENPEKVVWLRREIDLLKLENVRLHALLNKLGGDCDGD